MRRRSSVKKAMPHLPAFVLPRSVNAAVTVFFLMLCAVPVQAQPFQIQPLQMPGAAGQPAKGPDLDLSVHRYTRILTAEGVLRESRYEEKMMRRAVMSGYSASCRATCPGMKDPSIMGVRPKARCPRRKSMGTGISTMCCCHVMSFIPAANCGWSLSTSRSGR